MSSSHNGLAESDLSFTLEELNSYIEHRETGLSKKSQEWIGRAAKAFWHYTNGIINKNSLDTLRTTILKNISAKILRAKCFHLLWYSLNISQRRGLIIATMLSLFF
jgi:hypothetical protein